MTEYWQDESEGKPRHAIGVLRHRPHRIIRHRMIEPLRQWAKIAFVIAVATVSAASLATSVAVRDTSAAARWAPQGVSGPTSGTQDADPAPEVGPPTVDPSEDAQRRSQVGASTERATRERRPASSVPAASPVPPASSTSVPPSTSPSAGQVPTDPTPEPTPDPCDPKEDPDEQQEPPESESTGGDSDESTGGDSGEPADGSGGDEVPPVDGEPAPAQSETGS